MEIRGELRNLNGIEEEVSASNGECALELEKGDFRVKVTLKIAR